MKLFHGSQRNYFMIYATFILGFGSGTDGDEKTKKNSRLGKTILHFLVRQSTSIIGCVRWSVGRVTHSFDDPHVAPYWPTWPCFLVCAMARKCVS